MNGLKLTDLEERILSMVPSTSRGLSTKEICERLSGEYDHKDIDRAMDLARWIIEQDILFKLSEVRE